MRRGRKRGVKGGQEACRGATTPAFLACKAETEFLAFNVVLVERCNVL